MCRNVFFGTLFVGKLWFGKSPFGKSLPTQVVSTQNKFGVPHFTLLYRFPNMDLVDLKPLSKRDSNPRPLEHKASVAPTEPSSSNPTSEFKNSIIFFLLSFFLFSFFLSFLPSFFLYFFQSFLPSFCLSVCFSFFLCFFNLFKGFFLFRKFTNMFQGMSFQWQLRARKSFRQSTGEFERCKSFLGG